jgi:undecaprenyl-diphosphatase
LALEVLPVVGFFAALTAVRFAILASGAVQLSGDEAHYWEWSRRLDWCYYSKPPGVACLIRIGTLLFGDTELGVRFMAPVLSLLSSVVLYHLGKRLYDRKTGLAAALLLQVMPLFSAFGMGMTPDAPLIFFWLLSLYFLHRAWSGGAASDWLLLAVSLGLGLLSKYAVIFLYIPAILLLLTTAQGRQRLRTAWPYLSIVLSLAFFAPVLLWNSQHGWVMFRHDLGHVRVARGWMFSPWTALDFLGGQLAVVTPILAVLMVYLLIRRRREDPFSFWLTVPILAGFLIKSLQGRVNANWPLIAWLAAIPPMAAFLVHHYHALTINQKRWVTAGLIIPAVGTLFLHLPFILLNAPWPQGANPLDKLIGWRQLGNEVTQLAKEQDGPLFIFSDYYMTASELAFYVEGHPTTYCANLGRRMNQYDIWPGFDDLRGYDAIFVTGKLRTYPDLTAAFERLEPHPIDIHDRFGHVIKTFTIYRCYNFKGMPHKAPTHY